jgi:tripartite-type tricarboxylate transporter receptor subunit TctC
MRRTLLKAAIIAPAFSLLAFAAPATADTYPSKPIRMLLGYPAGSGIDTVARQLAERLTKSLGQTVIIENKPGALSNIAAQATATATPDGYTILFTPNSAPVANVYLFKKLPFDPENDFVPVATVATLGFVAVVNPEKTPVKNLQELTALIKKNPGKYSYGTGNATGQVVGALYTQLAGLDVLSVPYKGVPPAMTDLIGGRIDYVMADAPLAIPMIRSGRLKGLAVTNAKRVSALPDVPTMTESGLKEYDLSSWFGVYAPAKTPAPIVKLLEQHVRDAVSDKTLAAAWADVGVEAWAGTGEELGKQAAADRPKWGKIIKAAGIAAE